MPESTGRINNYVCEGCNHIHVTMNLNTGTTPFGIKCRECGGPNAYSVFYKCLKSSPVEYVWYRPTAEELQELEKKQPGWIEHCKNGGLVMRELEDEVKEDWECDEWGTFWERCYGNLH